MKEYLPTFSDNKDRIVYLLGEYRVTVSLAGLAVTIWLVFFPPSMPSIDPRIGWFLFGFALLLIPGWFIGTRIADWLYEPDLVRVAVCDDDPDGEEYTAYRVPPALWESKTVVGASPLRPENGQFDYVVTRWNYYEGINEIEVRGAERADLTPGEALETKERVDEYYEHHHELKRQYSRLKATLQDKITEVHDLTIMRMMEEREEADLAVDKTVTGIIDDMEQAVGDLPDGPADDSRNYGEKWLGDDLDTLDIDDAGSRDFDPMNSESSTVEAAADGGRDL